ncbi:hypothetical protein [Metabacillus malikii]|uniref:Uncharacterized protein n=1 Tax=Metabacillus malikii TaxID=1504265 RepID=A0ABT9ZB84_9BACI|nr:hypothetical protein [Metabacillus malikii]MDQ0229514.1 hypothetical protein [Metabacillus malikii]
MVEKELLTKEEQRLVDKLESEMFYASTRTHMNFYKNEIQTILSQAKRRHKLLKNQSHVAAY